MSNEQNVYDYNRHGNGGGSTALAIIMMIVLIASVGFFALTLMSANGGMFNVESISVPIVYTNGTQSDYEFDNAIAMAQATRDASTAYQSPGRTTSPVERNVSVASAPPQPSTVDIMHDIKRLERTCYVNNCCCIRGMNCTTADDWNAGYYDYEDDMLCNGISYPRS